MLSIQKLTKRYPNGLVALEDVSIDIPAGEVLALIGPSGAGKSTLIRCLNRLVEPTSGEIWLDDVNICALSPRRLRAERRSMGMIFQEYALVEQLSVMENVLSGRLGSVGFWRSALRRFPAEDVEGAIILLERLGLDEYLNTRADQLSGGQRQRVGIARALLQQPKLLLIDEPTASLDPRTARETMRLILELVAERNLAAIINIHDVTLARAFTQRIVGLAAGSIVFDGPPDTLDDTALTKIYGAEDWSTDAKADGNTPPRELDHIEG